METPIPQRLNGLTAPYSSPQIAAWAALALTVLEYCVVVAPVLHPAAIAPITIVFLGLVCAVVNFGAKAILTDPMDVHIVKELREKHKLPTADFSCVPVPPKFTRAEELYRVFNQERHEQYAVPNELMKQCWICDMQVADHSMHCKFCNKCIGAFDHHCMWLNTCIGKANYRFFFRTMLALISLEFYHLALHIYLIADLFLNGAGRPYPSTIALLIIFFFFLVFNILSISLIGQLILFHVKLQRRKQSTYEFIVSDHRERREKARMMGDLEARRVVLMERSTGLEAFRLRVGGMCRQMGLSQLDPLQPPPRFEPDPEAGFGTALGPMGGGGVSRESNPADTAEFSDAPAPLPPATPQASADFLPDSVSVRSLSTTERKEESALSMAEDIVVESPPDAEIGETASTPPLQQEPESDSIPGTDDDDDELNMNGDTKPASFSYPSALLPLDQLEQQLQDAQEDEAAPESFENEPMDDVSHHSSGCSSSHHRRGAERDYTNF